MLEKRLRIADLLLRVVHFQVSISGAFWVSADILLRRIEINASIKAVLVLECEQLALVPFFSGWQYLLKDKGVIVNGSSLNDYC